ncbi:hypothetical protein HPG69_003474 [Diceros bicornis minor]|uniref:Uncharacterized protein n=1 Tax=Diceros bicornis minor TaxID=77932 RepID=A0A7J7E8Y3_DICBM|nr:hypothetical protein HPG69_003474 [Diceros bicornis minor]
MNPKLKCKVCSVLVALDQTLPLIINVEELGKVSEAFRYFRNNNHVLSKSESNMLLCLVSRVT